MNKTKASSVIQTGKSAADGKGADSKHRRSDVRMVQNVLLIWLDGKIDRKSNDFRNTITHLRQCVNSIDTFVDGQECIQFLEDMANEKTCMIISGTLGQQIVPRVHNLSQVDSIFIFCSNKVYHEGWARDWSKIKGVFTKIEPICEALKQTVRRCEQNVISLSIVSSVGNDVEKSGNQLDSSFMYTQIMKETFLTIKFEQKHIGQFIQHCRELLAGNKEQLVWLDKFAREYRRHTPIWWYTCESFLYSTVNHALRTMDADLMLKMGFFIGDLHRHIEKLHRQQFSGHKSNQHLIVYRGQGMNEEALKEMIANKGRLLSFNNFLSTSKDRSTSLEFARRALADITLVGVLFVMNIDPTQSSTPFASIVDVSYFGKKEDEVLFSMHAVFRIGEITLINGQTRIFQVQLNMASDKDNDLRQLIDYMRKDTFPDDEGWTRLSLILWKMGESIKAQQICDTLLKQTTNESAKVPIYEALGLMKRAQGEYAAAITYYEKSIKIKEKRIPRNDLSLVMSYNNIGNVYYNMGNYRKALSFYHKDLEISQKTLPPTHPDLAMSYNNIGNVYYSMGEYSKALSSYQKALSIRQQSLPLAHPDVAMSHNNIAIVYYSMGDYSKALSFYEKALTIQQQSLPSTHPSLANTYYNIGLLYEKTGNYVKAHSCIEHAVDIAQHSLPANHPDLQDYRNSLIRIKKKL